MADVTLQITIPDAWTTRVLDAFNTITDTHMRIDAEGDPQNEFHGHWDFRIDAKGPGETNIQFGERVLRELGKAVVNMVDIAEDETRYKNAVSAISPAASDVPEDILT